MNSPDEENRNNYSPPAPEPERPAAPEPAGPPVLPESETAEELFGFMESLGQAVLESIQKTQEIISDDDLAEIRKVIAIMEAEPQYLPEGYGIQAMKNNLDALEKMRTVNQHQARVTQLMVLSYCSKYTRKPH